MYCTSRNAKQKYFSKQIMELIQAKKKMMVLAELVPFLV